MTHSQVKVKLKLWVMEIADGNDGTLAASIAVALSGLGTVQHSTVQHSTVNYREKPVVLDLLKVMHGLLLILLRIIQGAPEGGKRFEK